LAIAAGIGVRALFMPRPRRTLAQRLAELPRTAPLAAPITIHVNANHIPYIEAQSQSDLAVGVGIVHAHLRLTQMELLRHASQGRLSELVGPLGIEMDRALRLLDIGRAVPAIIEGLAPATREWAEGFVRGVNHVLTTMPHLPEEMRLLGAGREPWTLSDLFTAARLAGADVSWLVYGRLLRARARLSRAEWLELWPRLVGKGMPNPEGVVAGALARVGSNAAAVAGWRSASGAPLFAADPHLSISLPNIWLAIGMKSPGLNVVGLMPTGFPVVAIGRNPHLAWGGTSLHAAATDLFDASGETITEERVTLRVRGVGRRAITLRRCRLGPIASDGPMFRNDQPLAVKWVGQYPTDEMGAMLGVMRADSSAAFDAALERFGIPGQNMLHATVDGHIGHTRALTAPRRAAGPPLDLVQPAEDAAAWDAFVHTSAFPAELDPASGVVASANDAAPDSAVPVGFFFSPSDRVDRLHALLEVEETLDLDAMARTQTDVQARVEGVQAVLGRLPPHPARDVLAAWDGAYDTGSEGAVVWEAMMAGLSRRLPDQARLAPLTTIWTGRRLLAEEALALPDPALHPIAVAAMDEALAILRRHGSWGALHRMRIRHYFAAAPVVGRKYSFGEYASPGGNDTLNKTGNGPVTGVHPVTYGASARFLADLADPDANRVVLLGGQDGWLGSDTFADQVGPWQRGEYLPLPLRVETAREWPHHVVIGPA
jgi:penicillin amidase